MNTHTDDIDVLAQPIMAQGKKYVRSQNAEVLPPLASFSDCELADNAGGMTLVIFNKPLPEGIHWVEYDADLSLLTFVTWSGSVMELGIKVHAPFRKYLKMAKEIMLIQMSEDREEIEEFYPVELVIRHIGI